MKLSRRAFEKATKFIESYALDIDAAMYDFYFGDKEVNDVMETLQLYQHENGGFCRLLYGIEYTGPCVKATEHAFKYIHDLKPPVSHMVIPKMMKYVLDNYKPGLGNWGNLLVPEVNDYAHVWWWTYSKDEEDYNNFDDRLKARCFTVFYP